MISFEKDRLFRDKALGESIEIDESSRRKCIPRFSWKIPAHDGRTILLELKNVEICIYHAAGSDANPSSWAAAKFDLKIHYAPHSKRPTQKHKLGCFLLDDKEQILDEIKLGSFPDQCGQDGKQNLRKNFDARSFDLAKWLSPYVDVIKNKDYRRC